MAKGEVTLETRGELHPRLLIEQAPWCGEAELEFSVYVYKPDSLDDERRIVRLRGADLNAQWLSDALASLNRNEELALHSRVKIKSRTWHIPMIDFVGRFDVERVRDRIRKFLPRDIARTMVFVNSGRSFHGYSDVLLSPKEWLEFMGRLLLVNEPERDPVIDTRWVGHRLIAGYGALRWSNSSGLYRGMPRVETLMFASIHSQKGSFRDAQAELFGCK